MAYWYHQMWEYVDTFRNACLSSKFDIGRWAFGVFISSLFQGSRLACRSRARQPASGGWTAFHADRPRIDAHRRELWNELAHLRGSSSPDNSPAL